VNVRDFAFDTARAQPTAEPLLLLPSETGAEETDADETEAVESDYDEQQIYDTDDDDENVANRQWKAASEADARIIEMLGGRVLRQRDLL